MGLKHIVESEMIQQRESKILLADKPAQWLVIELYGNTIKLSLRIEPVIHFLAHLCEPLYCSLNGDCNIEA